MKWNEWSEVKWSEVKWSEVKWNEMNGNAMHIVLKYFPWYKTNYFHFFFFLKEDYYRVSIDEKVSSQKQHEIKEYVFIL